MRKLVTVCQKKVLKKLSGKIDDFYLAGGTALSLFYFQHRLSVDLDFFAPAKEFSFRRVEEIVAELENQQACVAQME